MAYLRNLPSAAVDYFSEVFKLVKFITSCCTCHECCEWVLGLCSWKAQDQYLRTTMSQKKIESLHDYPRSPANDWLIEHGRHWKSVCLNIKNNRQNRFLNGSINKLTIDNFLQKSSSLILYTGKFFLLSWKRSSSFNFLTSLTTMKCWCLPNFSVQIAPDCILEYLNVQGSPSFLAVGFLA